MRSYMECPICSTTHEDSVYVCDYCGAEISFFNPILLNSNGKDHTIRHHKAHFGRRFIANFIDLALLCGALFPSIIIFVKEGALVFPESTLFLVILLFLFQTAFLLHDHQTIGKKIMGLAIVCKQTGDAPRFSQLLLMRHILPWTLYCVPFIAPFILIANGVFFLITGERGLHDILSNTEVVRA